MPHIRVEFLRSKSLQVIEIAMFVPFRLPKPAFEIEKRAERRGRG